MARAHSWCTCSRCCWTRRRRRRSLCKGAGMHRDSARINAQRRLVGASTLREAVGRYAVCGTRGCDASAAAARLRRSPDLHLGLDWSSGRHRRSDVPTHVQTIRCASAVLCERVGPFVRSSRSRPAPEWVVLLCKTGAVPARRRLFSAGRSTVRRIPSYVQGSDAVQWLLLVCARPLRIDAQRELMIAAWGDRLKSLFVAQRREQMRRIRPSS